MKVISIGRSNDNDVHIDDLYVGRHHCQIVQHDNGTYTIVDMNSKNGTFVNGRRIFGEVQLHPYDSVTIGHTNLPWRSYFPSKSKSYALPIALGSVAGALLLVLAVLLLIRARGLGDGKVLYEGPEPPVTVVTLEEHGECYDVYAAEGQVIVVFKEAVSHKHATKTLKKNKAKVVGQMPNTRCYLVAVPAGKEGSFTTRMRLLPEVEFVFPNVIEDLLFAKPYALDDIYGEHGKMVVEMIEESGCSSMKYDIAPNGSVSSYKKYESIETILDNLGKNESAVINLSIGVSLTRWFGLWPWQSRVLWDEFMVTNGNRLAYKNRYIKDLVGFIAFVQVYDEKDFVIIKSAGNEGMKELEVFLNELRGMLEPEQLAVFERHFLIVSAKDDNMEGDYPNDVSLGHYDKMVTKADISDKTAKNLHWQGTSFSSPRVAGYITAVANKYGMKVVDVLDCARMATKNHPEHLLTMEGLTEQITKSKSSQVVENGTSVSPQPSMISTEQIKQDLVGLVIRDPSPNSYFPKDWTWTLKRNEITSVTIKNEVKTNSNQNNATVTIHLKRHQLSVDVDAVIRYRQTGSVWKYEGLTVQRITFPPQQDYRSYVKLYMDYDFMPSLMVKNTSGMALFVAGSYTTKGETTRFSAELEPYEEKRLGFGPSPDSYSIHFAYKE